MQPFTFEEYRRLVVLARERFQFMRYDLDAISASEGRAVLWRHDIDLSLETAVKIAQIEAEEGVSSTYFVHLHSAFYHPWEKHAYDRIHRLSELGHDIGLHFDAAFYGSEDLRVVLPHLKYEANFLSNLVGRRIRVFSAHNPTEHVLETWTENVYMGMVNTYGRFFRDQVDYVSDSNGIWRHRSIEEALLSPHHRLVQVLTHPGWWSAGVASPEQKMLRAIDARSRETESTYRSEARMVVTETPRQNQIRKAG